MGDNIWWSRQSSATRDLVVLAALGVVGFAVGVVFGTADTLDALVQRYERYQLDEILLVARIVALGALVFAIRRWREHRNEVERRRRVEEALEREVDSRDRLMATVSHEIRNPLTSVAGLSSYLADNLSGLDADEVHHTLQLISSEAYDATGLIDDLLLAARSHLDTIDVTITAVDLAAQVDQVLATLPAYETRLIWNPTPAWVDADPARLRQIIRNLLTNALRYGGPHLTVTITPHPRYVDLDVTDDGSGIPDELVHQLFEPFTRLTPEASRHFQSTGLGLTVSRDLAHRMHGDLTHHRTDHHTTFRLRLPAAPPQQSDDEPST